jgi:hypothetical protein
MAKHMIVKTVIYDVAVVFCSGCTTVWRGSKHSLNGTWKHPRPTAGAA